MNLESKKVTVNQPNTAVFEFLINAKNYQSLMPADSRFELQNENTFLFALKGMPEIVLKLKESKPHHLITLGSGGGKIEFSLQVKLKPINVNSCDVQLEFEGQFNPMISMMIKGPITKFIDTLVHNVPLAI